jgi:hypothetical protein
MGPDSSCSGCSGMKTLKILMVVAIAALFGSLVKMTGAQAGAWAVTYLDPVPDRSRPATDTRHSARSWSADRRSRRYAGRYGAARCSLVRATRERSKYYPR